jgi:hypothetical protein
MMGEKTCVSVTGESHTHIYCVVSTDLSIIMYLTQYDAPVQYCVVLAVFIDLLKIWPIYPFYFHTSHALTGTFFFTNTETSSIIFAITLSAQKKGFLLQLFRRGTKLKHSRIY